jgi:Icc protein
LLIAQITDTHIGFDRDQPDERNYQRLSAVLQRLATGPNRPDLLLITGDLTEFGDAESYRRLAQAAASVGVPVRVMAGNHDLREPLLAGFPQTPAAADGFIQYAMDFAGFRLVVLDTLELGRHGGAFCAARADWLAAELAAKPDVPTVIAMHHPPFAAGIDWLDSDPREEWIARFAATIAGHAQVKAIIAGHLHRVVHTLWNGVSLTVCTSVAPTVGLDLRPIDPDVPDGRAMIVDELPGYALHRWDGTRLVSHFETVGEFIPLAVYDAGMQQVVRMIEDERPA